MTDQRRRFDDAYSPVRFKFTNNLTARRARSCPPSPMSSNDDDKKALRSQSGRRNPSLELTAGVLLALVSLALLFTRTFWDVEGLLGGGLISVLVIISTASSSIYLLYNAGVCKLNRMKLKSMMASRVQQLSSMSSSSKDEISEDATESTENLEERSVSPADSGKRESLD